jgi:hypothetical protein
MSESPSPASESRPTRLHLVQDAPAAPPAATGNRAWRAVRAHPAISMVIAVVALGMVPSLVSELTPRGDAQRTRTAPPDPRYASQNGSAHDVRKTHIATRTDEEIDSAVETCGGVGLDHLAHKYGLPADPERVARRFAGGYERAFQAGIYRGCLRGLLKHPGG